MSLLNDIYSDDDGRSIFEVATDVTTLNRVARAWVKRRAETVISQFGSTDRRTGGGNDGCLQASRDDLNHCCGKVRLLFPDNVGRNTSLS